MTFTEDAAPLPSRQAVLDLLRRAAEAGEKAVLAEAGAVAASGNPDEIERLSRLESYLANDVLRRVCEAMKLEFEAVTERAAITEIDGGSTRLAAEQEAVRGAIAARTGWTPPSAFVKALFKTALQSVVAKIRAGKRGGQSPCAA